MIANAERVAKLGEAWRQACEGREIESRPCGGHRLPWRVVLWEGRHALADCRGVDEADALANALGVAQALDDVASSPYEATADCAAALLRGLVLQAGDVTAGSGVVIDWRTMKSGEVVLQAECAFDLAYLFVALVGPKLALREAMTAALPDWQPPDQPKEKDR